MQRVVKVGVLAAFSILLSALSGCTGMVQDDLDATHAKLAELQQMVQSANDQLESLYRIVNNLDDSHTIIPGSFKEAEDGYEVSFKDGKTVHIHFGTDGTDGKTLIPVGVLEKDGRYYWSVDGEPLRDENGDPIMASGLDGASAEILIEGENWILVLTYPDGHQEVKTLATVKDMDGVRVFSGYDTSDPTKLVLVLLDGTVIELPYAFPVKLSFEGPVLDTLTISAGEVLSIPYIVNMEGETDEPLAVTSGTDGIYFSQVMSGEKPDSGFVKVFAPDPFEEGYILLNAYCSGSTATKMISFIERVIPFADKTVRLGSGRDTRTVSYETNFEYAFTVESSDSESGTDWIEVKPDLKSGNIVFNTKANPGGSVRTCIVKITPKDNPDYVCTTFEVKQATQNLTYELEPAEGFSLYYPDTPEGLNKPELNASAAGGDVTLWITSPLKVDIHECPEWAKPVIIEEDGFYKTSISIDANESGTAREGEVKLKLGFITTAASITIKQAGK
jgi:hypothetical protein